MKYEPHPAAEIFPMMSDEEFAGLVEDIREHGLREPIILYDGKVLDGRNRLKACEQTGTEPRFEEWPNGEDPHFYVVSKNLHRRHLTEGQKAMLSAELATRPVGNPEFGPIGSQDPIGMSNDQAAELVGVSTPSIKRAKAVLRYGSPEDIEAVKRGEGLAPIARKLLKERQEEKAPAQPPAKIAADSRNVIRIPEGLSPEEWCRKGLGLERGGKSSDEAADAIGAARKTYRAMKEIVLLADRTDLSTADTAVVAQALTDMNETHCITQCHQPVKHIAERVWGERNQRSEKTVARRVEDFERAFGHIVQACSAADQIEIPHIGEDRARRAVGELREALRHARNLVTKLEELYQ